MNWSAVPSPDFVRLNRSVQVYSQSVVWVQQPAGAASGFAVGPNEVATNRHVVTNATTGKLVAPGEVLVVAKGGAFRVLSIHVPVAGNDDVAILRLAEDAKLAVLFRFFRIG